MTNCHSVVHRFSQQQNNVRSEPAWFGNCFLRNINNSKEIYNKYLSDFED